MSVHKNEKNGTWYVMVRYTDWQGNYKQKCKRGFATRRDAQEWEKQFLLQKRADVNMTLESFYALYEEDLKPRVKLTTWKTKENIIRTKIPYKDSAVSWKKEAVGDQYQRCCELAERDYQDERHERKSDSPDVSEINSCAAECNVQPCDPIL